MAVLWQPLVLLLVALPELLLLLRSSPGELPPVCSRPQEDTEPSPAALALVGQQPLLLPLPPELACLRPRPRLLPSPWALGTISKKKKKTRGGKRKVADGGAGDMVGASLPPLGDETGVGTVAGGVAGLGGEGSPAATPWLYKTKLISGRRGSEQLFGTVSEARFQELTQPIADSPEVARLPAADWQAMQALSPQDLFNQATEVCGQLQHERCFVMFSLFKERHPQFVEGYTNAGVALERMGRQLDALTLYRVAYDRFPGNVTAVNAIVNLLQAEAGRLYERQDFRPAAQIYSEICRISPDLADAFMNRGNILEQLGEFDKAHKAYLRAAELEPESVKPLNTLCRLKLMEVTGNKAGRFHVSDTDRLGSFELAKRYCSLAVQVEPADATANMNLGMLYKESLEFGIAIQYLEAANKYTNGTDIVVLGNLASALSREGDVPRAVTLAKRIIEVAPDPDPIVFYSIGTFLAPYERKSTEGQEFHITGIQKVMERVGPEPGGKCTDRTLRLDFLESEEAEVDVIDMPDFTSYFGQDSPNILPTSKLRDPIPLKFIDKQTIAVTIHDVYMEGPGDVLYTDCEMFAPVGVNSDIPQYFKASNRQHTTYIDDPVISIIHPSMNNYYHWTAETLTRLLLSVEYFWADGSGADTSARLLLPPESTHSHVWNAIRTLNIPMDNDPVIYEPKFNSRYKFRKLSMITWVQLNKDDPEQDDLWSDYLPSKHALQTLRTTARIFQDMHRPPPSVKPRPVVYLSRSGVREVIGEDILLDDLEELLGDNLAVFFKRDKGSRGSSWETLGDQISLFGGAKLLIGPHGAGLSNMVFAAQDASVLEFPMDPHCNRCFGYMAMALNLDYWVVPEVSCFYHKKYTMDARKSETVVKYVRTILKKKGLEHLIVGGAGSDSNDHDEL